MEALLNYLWSQSWQIAILVCLVAVATYLLRNRSAHIRYMLWLLLVLKCVVPPLMTIPVAILPVEQEAVSPIYEPVINYEPVVSADSVSVSVIRDTAPIVIKKTFFDTVKEVSLTTWLIITWAVGVGLFSSVAIFKAVRMRRWLIKNRKLPDESLQGYINDFTDGVFSAAKPRVWIVPLIGQPFVWGFFRGSIYLPASFMSIKDPNHKDVILAHELSHILRFDVLVNLLQIIAQSLFWFHPFVWWTNGKVRAEREKCCDETAIAQTAAEPKVFGSAIVNTLIAEHKAAMKIPTLAVAGPVRNIEERIKTIMKPNKKFYKRPGFLSLLILICLFIILIPTSFALTKSTASPGGGMMASTGVIEERQIQFLITAEMCEAGLNDAGLKYFIMALGGESVVVLDDSQAEDLRSLLEQGDSTLIADPRILITDGKSGTITTLNEVFDTSTSGLSVMNKITEPGIEMKIVPVWIEETGKVELDIKITTKDGEKIWGKDAKLVTTPGETILFSQLRDDGSVDQFWVLKCKIDGKVVSDKYMARSMQNLRGLKDTIFFYTAGNKNYPVHLEEILENKSVVYDYQWCRENVEYLGKGKNVYDDGRTVIAYDKTLLKEGKGTFVIFLDGQLEFVAPAELQKLGIIQVGTFSYKQMNSYNKLSELGKASVFFMRENDGKLSDDLKGFKPFMRNADYLPWLEENVLYLGKGVTRNDVAESVIAFDAMLLKKGKGTNVLFLDAHVEFVTPEKLEEYRLLIAVSNAKSMGDRAYSRERLKEIVTSAMLFANDNEGRLPDDVFELGKYGIDPQWCRANLEYLGKGIKANSKSPATTVIAYDKTLLKEGKGTNVLFLDGHVELVAPEELVKYGLVKAPPFFEQIQTRRMESGSKIVKLAGAILMYAADHSGDLPGSLLELNEYDSNIAWSISNVEYLGGGKKSNDGPDTIISYDKTLLKEGKGTNLGFLDGHVEFATPDELVEYGVLKAVSTQGDRVISKERLKEILTAAIEHAYDNGNKLPDSLFEMNEYGIDLQWCRANVEYLGYGKKSTDHPKTVLAYDKTMVKEGKGTNVAFNNQSVEYVKQDLLEKYGILKHQVSIEMRILKVGKSFIEDIGYSKEINWQEDFPKLDDAQVDFIIRATQAHTDSHVLTMPKVTVFDNEAANVSVCMSEVSKVVDFDERAGKPVVEYIFEGPQFVATPHVADKDNILLEFALDHSEITGFGDVVIKGKTYKNPAVNTINVESEATVRSGESFIQKFECDEDQFLVLIKATKVGLSPVRAPLLFDPAAAPRTGGGRDGMGGMMDGGRGGRTSGSSDGDRGGRSSSNTVSAVSGRGGDPNETNYRR